MVYRNNGVKRSVGVTRRLSRSVGVTHRRPDAALHGSFTVTINSEIYSDL
jgi:hypothetical protein